jgi:hypothetical protein
VDRAALAEVIAVSLAALLENQRVGFVYFTISCTGR